MQAIYDLAQICFLKGVRQVVLSPGSRCAPLTLAFTRHPHIECLTVTDERSAAYIAMGLAQSSQKPVIIVCTSGTAALNYMPAVAEAFYMNIPLIVITADRPPEWIDMNEGQSVHQQNVFGKHCRKSFQLLPDFESGDSQWFMRRVVAEAIDIATQTQPAPVHINIPFREPFYPDPKEKAIFRDAIFPTIIKGKTIPDTQFLKVLIDESKNPILIIGQMKLDPEVSSILKTLSLPIISDAITNARGTNILNHHDLFWKEVDEKFDLVITIGGQILSKPIKTYFKSNKPKNHVHIENNDRLSDIFQALSYHCQEEPLSVLKEIQFNLQQKTKNERLNYLEKKLSDYSHHELNQSTYSELHILKSIVKNIKSNSNIHLSNSMMVRYFNYLNCSLLPTDIEIFCNRGTSGIDGSSSTALGHAINTSSKTNYLFTGDLAFFYDRNAYWNNYIPDNFKIIVINNHGGGIFNMIDGPSKQAEAKEFFITKQQQTVKNTALDFGFKYYICTENENLTLVIEDFLNQEARAILEITTNIEENTKIFKKYKNYES